MLSVRDTAIWLALVLSLGGPACEKRSRSAERSPVAKDASPGPLPIDDGEPKEPPPPPTVKKSGKGDCKLEYAPRPKRDPNPMCLVKGGTFTMGSGEEDEPKRKMTLPSFYIDQFEVTVAQVVHYLNASPEHNRCPEGPEGLCMDPRPNAQHSPIYRDRKGRYQAFSGTERRPFWTATHYGAERYCRWAGKVLPTEVQWEYAARHDPVSRRDLSYPWGDQFEPAGPPALPADCKTGSATSPGTEPLTSPPSAPSTERTGSSTGLRLGAFTTWRATRPSGSPTARFRRMLVVIVAFG